MTVRIDLAAQADFEGFRHASRRLALAGVEPADVVWRLPGEADDLFATGLPEPWPARDASRLRVPARFVELCRLAVCHGDPGRYDLLYRLLRRIQVERRLLDDPVDADVLRLHEMAKSVRRDIHKMTAFLRFRQVTDDHGDEAYIAWFEPEHHIVAETAPFFTSRFAGMRWSILTPMGSAFWDSATLRLGPPGDRRAVPQADVLDDAWRTYYAAIFNPARLNTSAMAREMPKKYWRNLPEARLIPDLVAGARKRTADMIAAGPAAPSPWTRAVARGRRCEAGEMSEKVPTSLKEAAHAAEGCRRCGLYACATQVVFGEGPRTARMMLVGEQPGDREDLEGKPFVGPAGKLLDRALGEAGIDRTDIYVTNAVKHFKYQQRGKRRLHQKPDAGEITACRWWLDIEWTLVKPKLVVAMGATALRGVTGKATPVNRMRGRVHALRDGMSMVATVHPSFLLRVRDDREREFERFVGDLAAAREALAAA